jgi:metal-responsive CopG/Arc/MetJ family transcriptional regulator
VRPENVRRTARYTGRVKTAVSIPDDIFERADRVAAERRVTRSQLYAEALRRYLVTAETESNGDDITARLNAVYGEHPAGDDDSPLWDAAAVETLTSRWSS